MFIVADQTPALRMDQGLRSQRKDAGVLRYSRRLVILLIVCVSALGVLVSTLGVALVSRQLRQPAVVSATRVAGSPKRSATVEPQTTALAANATAETTPQAAAGSTPDGNAVATTPTTETRMTVSDAIRATALAAVSTPPPMPPPARVTTAANASGTQAQARAAAPRAPSTVRTAVASIAPTLRRGSTGVAVRAVQQLINHDIRCRSLPVEPLVVDGIYGVRTEGAVRAFQQQHGVVVDGIVGPATWQFLQRDLAKVGQQDFC